MHIYQCGEKATSRGVEYQCISLSNKERFDKYAMLGIVSSISMSCKVSCHYALLLLYILQEVNWNQDNK